MAENWKHLYEQMKKMVAMYQDEIVPGLRKQVEELEAKLAKDNNVPSKWISVKDRLPDTIPCGAGTEYSEAVNVLTDGRKVLTAIWNGLHWICDAEFWDAEFEEITHWTPVLLPLPEPTKGE